jgi:hypothetical protein
MAKMNPLNTESIPGNRERRTAMFGAELELAIQVFKRAIT